jgi:pimeloyl-ACP methyl ester carboxylesterase
MTDWAVDDFPYARSRRMREQQWLLDGAIRQLGVDWDQARSRYTMYAAGLDAEPDFARVRERIRKFDDIAREFAAAGERRERLSEEAERDGRSIEAREHAFVAAILWGNAQWPLFGNSPRVLDYGRHKADCFDRFIRHAPHPVRRVEIPFGDASLPGYLHLPSTGDGRFPCAIQVSGMDSFKEHQVALYGDKYLERGVARLAIELPGQGEALTRGLFVTHGGAADAGQAIAGWLAQQPDIDASRTAIIGNSFGSFWATQVAAAVPTLAGCAVVGVIHEPGMRSIFETASPTFKARFMYMADIADEAEFDAFAAGMDLRPIAGRIASPYLVLAGEDDELSPIANTFELLSLIGSPTRLVLYEAERHSVGGSAAARFGPNRHHLVAGWIADRLAGVPARDAFDYVESSGRVIERAPTWRTSSPARPRA